MYVIKTYGVVETWFQAVSTSGLDGCEMSSFTLIPLYLRESPVCVV